MNPVLPVSQEPLDLSPRSEIQEGFPGPITLMPGSPWTTAANHSKAVVHLCTCTPIFWSTPRILPFGSCLPSGHFSSRPEANLTCSPFLSSKLLFLSRLTLLPLLFSFWRSPVLVPVCCPPLASRGLACISVASIVQLLTPVVLPIHPGSRTIHPWSGSGSRLNSVCCFITLTWSLSKPSRFANHYTSVALQFTLDARVAIAYSVPVPP